MFAENIMLSLVVAPFVISGSLLTLIFLKRGFESLEYISTTSMSSLGSVQKALKPGVKIVWGFLSKHFDGKVSINTSSILLATIVVLFLVAILEFKDASAAAVAADKKKKKAE
jgi:hypothetical protein